MLIYDTWIVVKYFVWLCLKLFLFAENIFYYAAVDKKVCKVLQYITLFSVFAWIVSVWFGMFAPCVGLYEFCGMFIIYNVARIGLARAVYSDSEIILLDDCLSAVDSIVAKHIFDKVLDSKNGLLKNRIRILVTHQTQFLHRVDKIVVMNDGTVIDNDSLQNLEKKGLNIKSLVEKDTNITLESDSDEVVRGLSDRNEINELKSEETDRNTSSENDEFKTNIVEEDDIEARRVSLPNTANTTRNLTGLTHIY